jgi:hypothetical protein
MNRVCARKEDASRAKLSVDCGLGLWRPVEPVGFEAVQPFRHNGLNKGGLP